MCPSVDMTLCMEWENEKRDYFLVSLGSVFGGMFCTYVHTCACTEGREEGREEERECEGRKGRKGRSRGGKEKREWTPVEEEEERREGREREREGG